ncbi:MAG: hypothetical protein PHF91_02095 [Bacilli bacterium]|nr:hypothetical protein [Bacilli bacterium]
MPEIRSLDNQSLVKLEGISSQDYYYLGENKARQVLKDISLEVRGGDIFGLSSFNDEEVKVLCEIIGNLRPYYSGHCRVGTQGMVASKKIALPQLYYVDSYSNAYNNFKVLDYLMFITDKIKTNQTKAERQKAFLDELVNIGLGYIALTYMEKLTDTEKIIIGVLSGKVCGSKIVVANIADYYFDDDEIQVLKKIVDSIIEDKSRCVIIGTTEAKLIGIICQRTLFMVDGKERYQGGVEELIQRFDKVRIIITDSNQTKMIQQLKLAFPELQVEAEGKMILVKSPKGLIFDQNEFLMRLVKYNIDPDSIKINLGRVQNSFEEVAKK